MRHQMLCHIGGPSWTLGSTFKPATSQLLWLNFITCHVMWSTVDSGKCTSIYSRRIVMLFLCAVSVVVTCFHRQNFNDLSQAAFIYHIFAATGLIIKAVLKMCSLPPFFKRRQQKWNSTTFPSRTWPWEVKYIKNIHWPSYISWKLPICPRWSWAAEQFSGDPWISLDQCNYMMQNSTTIM